MSLKWNRLYKLGTDVAGFVFFHPRRLDHRKTAAIDWWSRDFEKEFRDGNLAAFSTGTDGTFTMKFIQRSLTTVEREVLVVSHDFRYHVRDARLYWDNTNALPSEEQLDQADDDPHGWLELSNGLYRLAVHALDWYSIPDSRREAESEISHYLVSFEEVMSLDEIPVPQSIPWLPASKEWYKNRNR